MKNAATASVGGGTGLIFLDEIISEQANNLFGVTVTPGQVDEYLMTVLAVGAMAFAFFGWRRGAKALADATSPASPGGTAITGAEAKGIGAAVGADAVEHWDVGADDA